MATDRITIRIPESLGTRLRRQSRARGQTPSELVRVARVQATEHIIYPRVLGWLAQQRLQWRDGAAWLDGARLDTPIVEDFRAAAA